MERTRYRGRKPPLWRPPQTFRRRCGRGSRALFLLRRVFTVKELVSVAEPLPKFRVSYPGKERTHAPWIPKKSILVLLISTLGQWP